MLYLALNSYKEAHEYNVVKTLNRNKTNYDVKQGLEDAKSAIDFFRNQYDDIKKRFR